MDIAAGGRARGASRARRRWRPFGSARTRILGWYIALVALALVTGLWLQRSILLNQMDDEVEDSLVQEAQELEQFTTGRNPATGEVFGTDIPAIFTTFLRQNIPVQDEAIFTIVDGRPFASSVAPLQLLDDPAVVSEWAGVTESERGEIDSTAGPVRYLAVPVSGEDGASGVFVAAMFMESRRADVTRVVRDGAIVYGGAFLVASILAWLAAGRVLRPVDLLTNTARSISEENWRGRISVEGDDEIVELARTFNDMLDRLEQAFAAQRQFIDDAGHELRTPITIIRGHLELLDSDPDEREEAVRVVLDELDRMSRIVDDLLLLAKSEAPGFLEPEPFDAREFLEDIAAKARALDPQRWEMDEAPRVTLVADRQRLTQALMNLVRNVVEHAEPGTPARLRCEVAGARARFSVSDSGPGISIEEQPHIFERFRRGAAGRRRTEGAGLGLAIVKAIAEAHGGSVELSSAPGAGSTFTVTLPIEPEARAS